MTTLITKSIGTTGRDYSTLQAWEDAIPASLVTTDEQWLGECYNDSEFTAKLNISAHTTDATRWIKLTAAAGQSFQDHANVRTNALKYDQTKGVGISYATGYDYTIELSGTTNYLTISRLQIKSTSPSGSWPINSNSNSGTNNIFKDLIVESARNGPTNLRGTIINVLSIIRVANTNFDVGPSSTFIGCTAVCITDATGTVGFNAPAYRNTITLNSCASFGHTKATQKAGTSTFAGNYNATDHASGADGMPGANSQHSVTFSSTTPFTGASNATINLIPVAGTNLINNGTLDSTNAPNDITGTARDSTPTIGVWEVVAGGSPSPVSIESDLIIYN